MAIVRTRRSYPERQGSSLFEEFDRFFNDVSTPLFNSVQTVNYPVDLYETDDTIVLEMAVPGLKAEDLDISLEGRSLAIRGRLPEIEDGGRRYWLQSIPRGDMSRNVKLPTNVDVEAIGARVRDGMLTLTMPKVAEAKLKKIDVLTD